MSKTKYIKVAVSERLPETAGYYFIVNIATGKQSGYFNGRTFSESFIDPEYWLEEVPDKESEMIDMLEACRKEIDYLNTFQPRTSTKEFISNLETLLNEINKQS